jgi:uncharacterized membrane protein
MTFFFIYCFLGWTWESCYVSIKERRWVNRGFLRLPMLPLYGFGAVLMLWVSIPFRGNYPAQYCAGVLAPTILEYVTGWGMEKLFKVRYWDYSYKKIQLNGYICLSSSLTWGAFTILMTDFLHPPIERLVLEVLNPIVDYVLVVGIGLLFAVDTVVSVKAAIDMRRALEKLTELRQQLEELQSQAQTLADTLKNEVKLGIKAGVTTRREELAVKMTALASRMDELNSAREGIAKGLSSLHRALLKGNPSARSTRFGAALRELKERFD